MLRRALIAVALALIAATVLSGCGPDVSPRVRIEGDTPVIAICADVVASEVEVLVGPGGSDPMDGNVYWRAEGDDHFRPGESIMAGVAPEGMAETVKPGTYDPARDDLIVNINPVDPDDEIQTRWLAAGSVSSSRWSNGNAVDDPCGD